MSDIDPLSTDRVARIMGDCRSIVFQLNSGPEFIRKTAEDFLIWRDLDPKSRSKLLARLDAILDSLQKDCK